MLKTLLMFKKNFYIYLYIILFIIGVIYSYNNEEVKEIFALMHKHKVVILDPGHGGFDPGVVVDDLFEKNINLEIALKVQQYLEQSGIYVYMTRIDDNATSNTKKGDMRTRKKLTNNSNADLLVSLHQNSFSSEKVYGSQVFFYDNSNDSRDLALSVQKELNTFADPLNKKKATPNSSYYLLKETDIPSIIVECGFLTNKLEGYKLTTDEYQDKIAWSIYIGILKYFETR